MRFGTKPSTIMRWVTRAVAAGLTKARWNPWPEEKVARLRALWFTDEAPSAQQVAAEMGETLRAVESQLQRMPNKRGTRHAQFWTPDKVAIIKMMKEAGKSDKEIGLLFGVSDQSVHRIRKAQGIGNFVDMMGWKLHEVEELTRLWGMGWSGTQIALRLDRTRSQVHAKIGRLGLNRPHAYPTVKKKADRDYASVAAAARARAGIPAKPRPKAGPKEDSNVIPLTARPWLTRGRGECSYPYGPRGEIHSCCLPVWNDTGQCEHHYALCHDLDRQKRRA